MGNTCLHYAVVAKDKDRVKLLLTPKYKSGKRVVSIAFFCFMLGLFSTVEYVSFGLEIVQYRLLGSVPLRYQSILASKLLTHLHLNG